MDNEIKPKNYRKLPITSLITGILSLTVFSFPALQMWVHKNYNYLFTTDTRRLIFNLIVGITLGIILPAVAIVCGSIDLARIRKGINRSKLFKGFDIIGIVLGSIIFMIVSLFMLGEIIIPH
jgi:hypothetical protein